MSRRLPRIRKVLSYSKGHGGDLERAMDALGPTADSPDELRRIFILGVTAHFAGYSTHRDSKGEHHLIRFMDQHPTARQLAQEILGVGGGFPMPTDIGTGRQPAASGHAGAGSAVGRVESPARREEALVASEKMEERSSHNFPGAPSLNRRQETSTSGGRDKDRSPTKQQARSAQGSANVQIDEQGKGPQVAHKEMQNADESAQFQAVSPGETPEVLKNLSNETVVQQKDVGNQPEISTGKTVSNLTIVDASLTVDASTKTVNPLTDASNENVVEDPVDEVARNAALGLMVRAMQDF